MVHLCEQLVRERDQKVQEEYDEVLQQRKAEQYDCFVRFTADQLQPTTGSYAAQQDRPTCKLGGREVTLCYFLVSIWIVRPKDNLFLQLLRRVSCSC